MNDLVTLSQAPQFQIPLKDGSFYTLEDKTLQMYKLAYPKIDVEDQVGRYIAWAVSAPSQRKTKRGILKSVNWWLGNQKPSQAPAATTTQKEYAASTTIQERVSDLSWADGL